MSGLGSARSSGLHSSAHSHVYVIKDIDFGAPDVVTRQPKVVQKPKVKPKRAWETDDKIYTIVPPLPLDELTNDVVSADSNTPAFSDHRSSRGISVSSTRSPRHSSRTPAPPPAQLPSIRSTSHQRASPRSKILSSSRLSMEPDTYFHPTEIRGPRPAPTVPATLPSLSSASSPLCFPFHHRPYTGALCSMVEPILQTSPTNSGMSDRIALRQALMHLSNRHKRGHVCKGCEVPHTHAHARKHDGNSNDSVDTSADTPTAASYAFSSPDIAHTHARNPSMPANPPASTRAASETRYYTLRAPRQVPQGADAHRLQEVREGLRAFLHGKKEGGAAGRNGMGMGMEGPLRDALPLQAAYRGNREKTRSDSTLFQIGPDSRHRRSENSALKKSEPENSGLGIRVGNVDNILDEIKSVLTSRTNVMFGAPGILSSSDADAIIASVAETVAILAHKQQRHTRALAHTPNSPAAAVKADGDAAVGDICVRDSVRGGMRGSEGDTRTRTSTTSPSPSTLATASASANGAAPTASSARTPTLLPTWIRVLRALHSLAHTDRTFASPQECANALKAALLAPSIARVHAEQKVAALLQSALVPLDSGDTDAGMGGQAQGQMQMQTPTQGSLHSLEQPQARIVTRVRYKDIEAVLASHPAAVDRLQQLVQSGRRFLQVDDITDAICGMDVEDKTRRSIGNIMRLGLLDPDRFSGSQIPGVDIYPENVLNQAETQYEFLRGQLGLALNVESQTVRKEEVDVVVERGRARERTIGHLQALLDALGRRQQRQDEGGSAGGVGIGVQAEEGGQDPGATASLPDATTTTAPATDTAAVAAAVTPALPTTATVAVRVLHDMAIDTAFPSAHALAAAVREMDRRQQQQLQQPHQQHQAQLGSNHTGISEKANVGKKLISENPTVPEKMDSGSEHPSISPEAITSLYRLLGSQYEAASLLPLYTPLDATARSVRPPLLRTDAAALLTDTVKDCHCSETAVLDAIQTLARAKKHFESISALSLAVKQLLRGQMRRAELEKQGVDVEMGMQPHKPAAGADSTRTSTNTGTGTSTSTTDVSLVPVRGEKGNNGQPSSSTYTTTHPHMHTTNSTNAPTHTSTSISASTSASALAAASGQLDTSSAQLLLLYLLYSPESPVVVEPGVTDIYTHAQAHRQVTSVFAPQPHPDSSYNPAFPIFLSPEGIITNDIPDRHPNASAHGLSQTTTTPNSITTASHTLTHSHPHMSEKPSVASQIQLQSPAAAHRHTDNRTRHDINSKISDRMDKIDKNDTNIPTDAALMRYTPRFSSAPSASSLLARVRALPLSSPVFAADLASLLRATDGDVAATIYLCRVLVSQGVRVASKDNTVLSHAPSTSTSMTPLYPSLPTPPDLVATLTEVALRVRSLYTNWLVQRSGITTALAPFLAPLGLSATSNAHTSTSYTTTGGSGSGMGVSSSSLPTYITNVTQAITSLPADGIVQLSLLPSQSSILLSQRPLPMLSMLTAANVLPIDAEVGANMSTGTSTGAPTSSPIHPSSSSHASVPTAADIVLSLPCVSLAPLTSFLSTLAPLDDTVAGLNTTDPNTGNTSTSTSAASAAFAAAVPTSTALTSAFAASIAVDPAALPLPLNPTAPSTSASSSSYYSPTALADVLLRYGSAPSSILTLVTQLTSSPTLAPALTNVTLLLSRALPDTPSRVAILLRVLVRWLRMQQRLIDLMAYHNTITRLIKYAKEAYTHTPTPPNGIYAPVTKAGRLAAAFKSVVVGEMSVYDTAIAQLATGKLGYEVGKGAERGNAKSSKTSSLPPLLSSSSTSTSTSASTSSSSSLPHLLYLHARHRLFSILHHVSTLISRPHPPFDAFTGAPDTIAFPVSIATPPPVAEWVWPHLHPAPHTITINPNNSSANSSSITSSNTMPTSLPSKLSSPVVNAAVMPVHNESVLHMRNMVWRAANMTPVTTTAPASSSLNSYVPSATSSPSSLPHTHTASVPAPVPVLATTAASPPYSSPSTSFPAPPPRPAPSRPPGQSPRALIHPVVTRTTPTDTLAASQEVSSFPSHASITNPENAKNAEVFENSATPENLLSQTASSDASLSSRQEEAEARAFLSHVIAHDSSEADVVFLAELATVMQAADALPTVDNAGVARVFYASGARRHAAQHLRSLLADNVPLPTLQAIVSAVADRHKRYNAARAQALALLNHNSCILVKSEAETAAVTNTTRNSTSPAPLPQLSPEDTYPLFSLASPEATLAALLYLHNKHASLVPSALGTSPETYAELKRRLMGSERALSGLTRPVAFGDDNDAVNEDGEASAASTFTTNKPALAPNRLTLAPVSPSARVQALTSALTRTIKQMQDSTRQLRALLMNTPHALKAAQLALDWRASRLIDIEHPMGHEVFLPMDKQRKRRIGMAAAAGVGVAAAGAEALATTTPPLPHLSRTHTTDATTTATADPAITATVASASVGTSDDVAGIDADGGGGGIYSEHDIVSRNDSVGDFFDPNDVDKWQLPPQTPHTTHRQYTHTSALDADSDKRASFYRRMSMDVVPVHGESTDAAYLRHLRQRQRLHSVVAGETLPNASTASLLHSDASNNSLIRLMSPSPPPDMLTVDVDAGAAVGRRDLDGLRSPSPRQHDPRLPLSDADLQRVIHEAGAGPDTVTHVAALARQHDRQESKRLMEEVVKIRADINSRAREAHLSSGISPTDIPSDPLLVPSTASSSLRDTLLQLGREEDARLRGVVFRPLFTSVDELIGAVRERHLRYVRGELEDSDDEEEEEEEEENVPVIMGPGAGTALGPAGSSTHPTYIPHTLSPPSLASPSTHPHTLPVHTTSISANAPDRAALALPASTSSQSLHPNSSGLASPTTLHRFYSPFAPHTLSGHTVTSNTAPNNVNAAADTTSASTSALVRTTSSSSSTSASVAAVALPSDGPIVVAGMPLYSDPSVSVLRSDPSQGTLSSGVPAVAGECGDGDMQHHHQDSVYDNNIKGNSDGRDGVQVMNGIIPTSNAAIVTADTTTTTATATTPATASAPTSTSAATTTATAASTSLLDILLPKPTVDADVLDITASNTPIERNSRDSMQISFVGVSGATAGAAVAATTATADPGTGVRATDIARDAGYTGYGSYGASSADNTVAAGGHREAEESYAPDASISLTDAALYATADANATERAAAASTTAPTVAGNAAVSSAVAGSVAIGTSADNAGNASIGVKDTPATSAAVDATPFNPTAGDALDTTTHAHINSDPNNSTTITATTVTNDTADVGVADVGVADAGVADAGVADADAGATSSPATPVAMTPAMVVAVAAADASTAGTTITGPTTANIAPVATTTTDAPTLITTATTTASASATTLATTPAVTPATDATTATGIAADIAAPVATAAPNAVNTPTTAIAAAAAGVIDAGVAVAPAKVDTATVVGVPDVSSVDDAGVGASNDAGAGVHISDGMGADVVSADVNLISPAVGSMAALATATTAAATTPATDAAALPYTAATSDASAASSLATNSTITTTVTTTATAPGSDGTAPHAVVTTTAANTQLPVSATVPTSTAMAPDVEATESEVQVPVHGTAPIATTAATAIDAHSGVIASASAVGTAKLSTETDKSDTETDKLDGDVTATSVPLAQSTVVSGADNVAVDVGSTIGAGRGLDTVESGAPIAPATTAQPPPHVASSSTASSAQAPVSSMAIAADSSLIAIGSPRSTSATTSPIDADASNAAPSAHPDRAAVAAEDSNVADTLPATTTATSTDVVPADIATADTITANSSPADASLASVSAAEMIPATADMFLAAPAADTSMADVPTDALTAGVSTVGLSDLGSTSVIIPSNSTSTPTAAAATTTGAEVDAGTGDGAGVAVAAVNVTATASAATTTDADASVISTSEADVIPSAEAANADVVEPSTTVTAKTVSAIADTAAAILVDTVSGSVDEPVTASTAAATPLSATIITNSTATDIGVVNVNHTPSETISVNPTSTEAVSAGATSTDVVRDDDASKAIPASTIDTPATTASDTASLADVLDAGPISAAMMEAAPTIDSPADSAVAIKSADTAAQPESAKTVDFTPSVGGLDGVESAQIVDKSTQEATPATSITTTTATPVPNGSADAVPAAKATTGDTPKDGRALTTVHDAAAIIPTTATATAVTPAVNAHVSVDMDVGAGTVMGDDVDVQPDTPTAVAGVTTTATTIGTNTAADIIATIAASDTGSGSATTANVINSTDTNVISTTVVANTTTATAAASPSDKSIATDVTNTSVATVPLADTAAPSDATVAHATAADANPRVAETMDDDATMDIAGDADSAAAGTTGVAAAAVDAAVEPVGVDTVPSIADMVEIPADLVATTANADALNADGVALTSDISTPTTVSMTITPENATRDTIMAASGTAVVDAGLVSSSAATTGVDPDTAAAPAPADSTALTTDDVAIAAAVATTGVDNSMLAAGVNTADTESDVITTTTTTTAGANGLGSSDAASDHVEGTSAVAIPAIAQMSGAATATMTDTIANTGTQTGAGVLIDTNATDAVTEAGAAATADVEGVLAMTHVKTEDVDSDARAGNEDVQRAGDHARETLSVDITAVTADSGVGIDDEVEQSTGIQPTGPHSTVAQSIAAQVAEVSVSVAPAESPVVDAYMVVPEPVIPDAAMAVSQEAEYEPVADEAVVNSIEGDVSVVVSSKLDADGATTASNDDTAADADAGGAGGAADESSGAGVGVAEVSATVPAAAAASAVASATITAATDIATADPADLAATHATTADAVVVTSVGEPATNATTTAASAARDVGGADAPEVDATPATSVATPGVVPDAATIAADNAAAADLMNIADSTTTTAGTTTFTDMGDTTASADVADVVVPDTHSDTAMSAAATADVAASTAVVIVAPDTTADTDTAAITAVDIGAGAGIGAGIGAPADVGGVTDNVKIADVAAVATDDMAIVDVVAGVTSGIASEDTTNADVASIASTTDEKKKKKKKKKAAATSVDDAVAVAMAPDTDVAGEVNAVQADDALMVAEAMTTPSTATTASTIAAGPDDESMSVPVADTSAATPADAAVVAKVEAEAQTQAEAKAEVESKLKKTKKRTKAKAGAAAVDSVEAETEATAKGDREPTTEVETVVKSMDTPLPPSTSTSVAPADAASSTPTPALAPTPASSITTPSTQPAIALAPLTVSTSPPPDLASPGLISPGLLSPSSAALDDDDDDMFADLASRRRRGARSRVSQPSEADLKAREARRQRQLEADKALLARVASPAPSAVETFRKQSLASPRGLTRTNSVPAPPAAATAAPQSPQPLAATPSTVSLASEASAASAADPSEVLTPAEQAAKEEKQKKARSKASAMGFVFEDTWFDNDVDGTVQAIRTQLPEVYDEYLALQVQAQGLSRSNPYVTVERFRQPIWERVAVTEIAKGSNPSFTPLFVSKSKWTFDSDRNPVRLVVWNKNNDREPTVTAEWEGDLHSLYSAEQEGTALPLYKPDVAANKRVPSNASGSIRVRGLDGYFNLSHAVVSSDKPRGALFYHAHPQCMVRLQFECVGCEQSSLLGPNDSYMVVSKPAPTHPYWSTGVASGEDWEVVLSTEVVEHSNDPHFNMLVCDSERLCSGQYECPLRFQLFHKGTVGSSLIGQCQVSTRQLIYYQSKGQQYPLVNPAKQTSAKYVHSGLLKVNVATVFGSKATLVSAARAALALRNIAVEEAKLQGYLDRYLALLNRGVLSKGLTAADADALRVQAQAKMDKARQQMGLRRDDIEAHARAQLTNTLATSAANSSSGSSSGAAAVASGARANTSANVDALASDMSVLQSIGKSSGRSSKINKAPASALSPQPLAALSPLATGALGSPTSPGMMSPMSPASAQAAAAATAAAAEVHPEEYLCFRVSASQLPRGDLFGSTDSYVELSCQRDGNWVPVIASDIVSGTAHPLYAPLACKAKELFSNLDASLPIRVCVWQWHRNKAPTLLGEAVSTLAALKRAGGERNSNNTPKYGVHDMKKKEKVAQGVGTMPDECDWTSGPLSAPLDIAALTQDARTVVLPLGKPGKKKKEGYVVFEKCDVMHDKVARRTLQAVSMARVSENAMTEKDVQMVLQSMQQETTPIDLLSIRSTGSKASRRNRK